MGEQPKRWYVIAAGIAIAMAALWGGAWGWQRIEFESAYGIAMYITQCLGLIGGAALVIAEVSK